MNKTNILEIKPSESSSNCTDPIYGAFRPDITLNGEKLNYLHSCTIICKDDEWSRVILEFTSSVEVTMPVTDANLTIKQPIVITAPKLGIIELIKRKIELFKFKKYMKNYKF